MIVQDIRERVRAEGLLGEGPIVVMLSGGRDSLCLLDVAVALCGGERVHALHLNYGLRPEADEDERHCRELCERLGVRLEAVRAGGEAEREGNLQAWARELRYRAAERLAERLDGERLDGQGLDGQGLDGEGLDGQGFDREGLDREGLDRERLDRRPAGRARIAAGHTSSDQLETILYRLAASPGRRALLGMARSEGRLVRPLLDVTREQTADYCRERGLRWREDASNEDERYARARVRRALVPALRTVHPAAAENVLRTAGLLREESELLDALVDAELDGRDGIPLQRLRALPAALQRLVTIRLAERAAGTFVPQAGERVAEILALAGRGGRAELHVGGLASAVLEQGMLRFVKIAPREQRATRNRSFAKVAPHERRARRHRQ